MGVDMTNWTKHTGIAKPEGLADAQIVEVRDADGTAAALPVERMDWSRFKGEYHPALNPDGRPYVSAEGLEPWAKYVATDENGEVTQFEVEPELFLNAVWDSPPDGVWSNSQTAPPTHRKPGDPADSLMRVWRENANS